MIGKLDPIKHTDNLYDRNGFITNVACGGVVISKLNELIDTVNTIQKEREAERFEIQEWIGILEAVRKSVNVHEKQIDELQMKVEPEKCKIPAENVLTKSLRVDKEFAEEECVRLQNDLERTRKALETAVSALKYIQDGNLGFSPAMDFAEKALDQITALKQKDK